MARPVRSIAVALVALLVVAAGAVVLQQRAAQAYGSMPRAYQAYWTWVSSVNRDEARAETGIELLYRHPELRPLYLRLAQACEVERQADCDTALRTVRPPDAVTAQYREAALALLDADDRSAARWASLARNPALDLPLMRLVVEHEAGELGLDAAQAHWQDRLAADSTLHAPAFGLALTALGANDWQAAERHLRRLERLTPDEPDVYRELGRIYFLTGRTEALREALLTGIAAAEARHDYEGVLVLRGNLALSLLQRGTDLDLAERLLTDALQQSQHLGDRERVALNYYRLGTLRAQQMRYDAALALLDSAQATAPETASRLTTQVQTLRGTVEWALFRFSDARATLEAAHTAALSQNMILEAVQADVSLAQLHHRAGRRAESRAAGLRALEQATRYGLTDAAIAAHLALGDAEAATGNFDQAMRQFRAGLDLARAQGITARLHEASTRMGQVMLSLTDASGATEYLEEVLESTPGNARVYEGMGRIYHAHGNYAQALTYYEHGLKHVQNEPELRVTLPVNAAWAHLGNGNVEAAGASVRQARQALGSRAGASQAALLVAAAEGAYLFERGAYAPARRAFEQALALSERLEIPAHEWHLLHGIALSAWHQGQHADAEQAFRRAVSVVEALRDNLNDARRRASFIQDKVAVYKHFAAFLNEQGRTREAFHMAERVRSRSLADLFATSLAARSGDASDPEARLLEARRRQQALAEGLEAVYAGAGTAPHDQVRASQLRREFSRADSLYRASFARLDSDGVYTALAHPVEIDAVQQALRPHEALVFYTIGGTTEADVRAFVVTPTAVRLVALPVESATLRRSVAVYRDQISASNNRPGQGWETTSRHLYERLMAPVVAALPAGVTHLNIVPEAELHYLPFASLQNAEGRFLVERFALSVVPSASIFCLARARGEETRGRWRRVLALADPQAELPGTRREVEAIRAIKAIRVDALFGEQATAENLKLLAPEADILHIATHGYFDTRAPWASGLELYREDLTVADVGSIGLDRPYLVVLSACETALGGGAQSDVPAGDEWVGLNQAFLAAGAPSVMASLWPISDRASSAFVTLFYNALLDTEGKATALAQAQRAFIRDARFAHPYYWAAFTLTGDPF